MGCLSQAFGSSQPFGSWPISFFSWHPTLSCPEQILLLLTEKHLLTEQLWPNTLRALQKPNSATKHTHKPSGSRKEHSKFIHRPSVLFLSNPKASPPVPTICSLLPPFLLGNSACFQLLTWIPGENFFASGDVWEIYGVDDDPWASDVPETLLLPLIPTLTQAWFSPWLFAGRLAHDIPALLEGLICLFYGEKIKLSGFFFPFCILPSWWTQVLIRDLQPWSTMVCVMLLAMETSPWCIINVSNSPKKKINIDATFSCQNKEKEFYDHFLFFLVNLFVPVKFRFTGGQIPR